MLSNYPFQDNFIQHIQRGHNVHNFRGFLSCPRIHDHETCVTFLIMPRAWVKDFRNYYLLKDIHIAIALMLSSSAPRTDHCGWIILDGTDTDTR